MINRKGLKHISPIYESLHTEYVELKKKAGMTSGDELNLIVFRLREIDLQLREAEAAIPRWYGPTTNYKNALGNNIAQEMEVNAICTNLIINSRWAGWLPFGWMHSLAASYYARKARRIYANKKVAEGLTKLQKL